MCENEKDSIDNIIIGGGSSFLSFAITIVNFLSAMFKYNQLDVRTLDICDVSFLTLIIVLLLTSIDLILTYKGYRKNILVNIAKGFACFSAFFSGMVCLFAVLIIINVCGVNENGLFTFIKNFSFVHTTLKFGYFKIGVCLHFYLGAAFLQLIANISKYFATKKSKKKYGM